MKAGCSPHRGTSKGSMEEHHGEVDLRVYDGRRPWITRGSAHGGPPRVPENENAENHRHMLRDMHAARGVSHIGSHMTSNGR